MTEDTGPATPAEPDNVTLLDTRIDEPSMTAGEVEMLLFALERSRAQFAWKCGGLDAAALRATVGASSMTLGGMLKHLARFEDDMSTEWLHGRGQLPPWNSVDWDTDSDWDWRTAADETSEQLYARWQDAVVRSRSLIAAALADGGVERPGTGITDDHGQSPTLRYILLNMIEEYARHNGHADLLRESVDGLVGHDPPE